MAWTSGTATGHVDLLNKLVSFLSTNADLVAAGQEWEVVHNDVAHGPFTWPYSRIAFGNPYTLANYGGVFPDGLPTWLTEASTATFILTGTLNISTAGSYTFGLDGYGSSDIIIDGVNVVNRYNSGISNNLTSATGAITLSTGAHTFQLRAQMSNGTNFGLSVGIKPPSGSMAIMSTTTYLSGIQAWMDASHNGTPSVTADMDVIFDNCRSVTLRGKGMSGTDNIYTSFLTSSSSSGDYYNLSLWGHTAFDITKRTNAQTNVSGGNGLLLWNQSIPYWFIANGRRFIVVAKVSTVYETMYGGFALPYATPTEYPFPMFIGTSANSATVRWSNNNGNYGGYDAFWDSGYPVSSQFRDPYGNWLGIANRRSALNSSDDHISQVPGATYPYYENPGWRTAPDGSYALTPITYYTEWGRGNVPSSSNSTGGVFGELDGVFHVSGYANASENILTIDGVNYLVVQSTYHTGYNSYAAIALS